MGLVLFELIVYYYMLEERGQKALFLSEYLTMLIAMFQLWTINSGKEQNKGPGATYKTSLSYHTSAVNVLRFSPSGKVVY